MMMASVTIVSTIASFFSFLFIVFFRQYALVLSFLDFAYICNDDPRVVLGEISLGLLFICCESMDRAFIAIVVEVGDDESIEH